MDSYINIEQGLILIKLLTAHLFTDFIVQPESWVNSKKERKYKSPFLYYHVAIAGLSSYLLLMQLHNWYVPLFIAITHYFIDLWKLSRKDNLTYFLLDQGLHVAVILFVWLTMLFNGFQILQWASQGLNDYTTWLILLGLLFVIFPAQDIMKYATQRWATSFEDSDKDTLKDAGKWIGIFERILILILVLYNQYEAIGFLIAGKSFIRFSESGGKTRAQTEYILIGTLISFTLAIGTGVVLVHLLGK
ncbi:MAG TPA: DUF3307 domain-containing protein [Cytophagaceae bacterium]|jgi:hypothetical protein